MKFLGMGKGKGRVLAAGLALAGLVAACQTPVPATPEPTLPILTTGQEAPATPSPQPPLAPTRGYVPASPSPALPEPTPNHLLPDLQTLPPTNLRLIYDASSGRRLIRFANSIWNAGDGRLELVGERQLSGDSVLVTQRIYAPGGSFETALVGEFVFHSEHNHWHFDDFSEYQVVSITALGALGDVVASNDKVGYCLMDVSFQDEEEAEREPRAVFSGCDARLQGLAPGWVDTYRAHLPDQWVDVSALPDGVYALRSIVDPHNLLMESDESNNAAIVYFQILNNRLEMVEPPTKLFPVFTSP